MRTSETLDKLATALAKAQGKIRNPEKNKTVSIKTKSGDKYTYSYADLPVCYDSARDALAENELSHFCVITHGDYGPSLIMRLMHTSGQWIESEYLLPGKVDEKTLAASITYGRRYLFCALIGLAAEEDTDSQPESGDSSYGNTKPQPGAGPVIAPKVITPPSQKLVAASTEELDQLFAFIKSTNIPMDEVKKFMKEKLSVESSLDLTSIQCQSMKNWVTSRLKNNVIDPHQIK